MVSSGGATRRLGSSRDGAAPVDQARGAALGLGQVLGGDAHELSEPRLHVVEDALGVLGARVVAGGEHHAHG